MGEGTMDIRLVSDEDFLCLEISGQITQNGLAAGEDILTNLLGPDVYGRRVLCDLKKAAYVDSSGIAWLLVAHKRFRDQGGRWVLHGIPPMVSQVITVLRMHLVFEIAEHEQEARRLASQEL